MAVTRFLFVPFAGDTPLVGRKRRAVWDNVGRNTLVADLVADLAAGLVDHARETLRGLGVGVAGVNLSGRVRQRVVVLAETAEQARRLETFLPGWEVLDAVPVDDYDGRGNEPATDDEYDPPGGITTLVYAARNGIACGIVVRATAGTGKLNWNAVRGGNDVAGTTPALVVDVADRILSTEDKDSGIRRREYREQGLAGVTVTKPKRRVT